MRATLRVGVAVLLAALVARLWFADGLVAPLVVEGGSMAPHLVGDHRRVACSDCGWPYDCGEESWPAGSLAICPNCGARSDLNEAPLRPGNRLIVDRRRYELERPERWDVVVLWRPDAPRRLCVKRVVGLPGEQVELRAGDVYIDGRPADRRPDQLLAMAVPVYSDAHRPAREGAAPRWSQVRQTPIDWLVYQHRQFFANGPTAGRVGPILDDLAYHQGESRLLQPVGDVILRCRLPRPPARRMWLRARDRQQEFVLCVDGDDGQVQLTSAGQQLAATAAGRRPLAAGREMLLALVDGRVLLSLDGRVILEHAYDRDPLAGQPVSEPFGIGFEPPDSMPTNLQVLRDVQYLPGPGGNGGPWQLGSDEYFVLGDHSAVSVDSRTWLPRCPVRRQMFVGKVLPDR